MVILSAFVEVLLPVTIVVASGYALRHRFELDLPSLNRLSMYVLGPALIFTTIVRIDVAGNEALRIIAASVTICLGMGVIGLITGVLLRLDRGSLAALLLCVMFMNSGNYGLPTSRLAFGEAGFQRALLYFIAQTILAQTLAAPIASAGQSDLKSAVRQMFAMPQIYAVTLGLLARFSGIDLPHRSDAFGSAFRGVALMADAALPLLLLLLGMQLANGTAVEDVRLMAVVAVLRLGVSPVLAYGIARALALDDLAWRVVVLEASMPTAVNMALYSLEFNARPRFVAGVVAATTVMSLVTLTLLLSVLR
ncbi:MAG: AEC family transporter [Roseiflexus sp.]|nr:AEC family transporter [Roseiflexus sp.]MCS7288675.1 AEC family transporter [Roseiflexus sp.]MDW8147219.1 AEC family transporter [Roseiflexaceae bacterium]MDW8233072.1 AEC family transporter [Roseiflexaceae bacterium]